MELLDKENAIRRLLGKPLLSQVYEHPGGNQWVRDARGELMREIIYYDGIDSIGIVLRDVVPRLVEEVTARFCSDGSGAITDYSEDENSYAATPICEYMDLASMPAACCDALLRKEGLL